MCRIAGVTFVIASILTVSPAIAVVSTVNPSLLSTTDVEDFSSFVCGSGSGVPYDDVIHAPGISFAERFMGQSLSYLDDFDVVSGSPISPLLLQPGNLQENLAIADGDSPTPINVLAGLGWMGWPDPDANGEGAVAILFAIGHFEFGMDVIGADGGTLKLDFLRRDGTLINSLSLTAMTKSYAFRCDASSGNEIAGVVITNIDPYGLAYDNVRYYAPEPVSFSLLAFLGGLTLWRRR